MSIDHGGGLNALDTQKLPRRIDLGQGHGPGEHVHVLPILCHKKTEKQFLD